MLVRHGLGVAPGLQSHTVAPALAGTRARITAAVRARPAMINADLCCKRPSMAVPHPNTRPGTRWGTRLARMEDWLDPCLDADEMRATDAWAIEKQGVPGLELMETAGAAVARTAAEAANPGRALIVCGKGNNGGDGLVAARHLTEIGFEAEALLLGRPSDMSDDARDNLDRF